MRLWLFLLVQVVSARYHTTNHLLSKVKFLCTVSSYLQCSEEKGIMVVDYLPNEPRDTLWVFNEHARERITGELALHVLEQVIATKPQKRITIIPVLNVWGRKQVDDGDFCRRKNRNEVDTNRNYQIKERHHYYKDSEEYEGPSPLSEKETQLVSDILLQGVKRYINVHSGEFSMYMPYDSNTSPPPHADKMRAFLTELHPMCPECSKGQAAKVSFYKAFGTSVDYAIRIGIPEAYTFEIYGATSYKCQDMFNPKSTNEYIRVLNMWTDILLASLNIE